MRPVKAMDFQIDFCHQIVRRAGIEMMEIYINENEQVTSVCWLVRRFANEIDYHQKEYRDDLFVSCLQIII
ncbi:unnamed protein product [Rotaria sp. Silwood2]|nr:unnamed protein product [Rotaria sp. Silwood2]CAF4397657.1 unnamed protein product [Rotaria sp. Silwood2]